MEHLSDKTDFLMPGHVWVHRKKQTNAVVMFLTNQHLSEKLAATYPPQVVYADTNGNVTSVPVDEFMRTRDFSHVDPKAEAAITGMVNLDDEDPQVEEATPAATEAVTATSSTQTVDLALHSSTNEAMPVVEATTLYSSITAYWALPTEDGGQIHHMEFALSENLNNENIHTAFSSEIVRYASAEIGGVGFVNWDEFRGVYPSVQNGNLRAVAVFAELPVKAAPVKKAAPAKTAPTKAVSKPAPSKTAPVKSVEVPETSTTGKTPAAE